MKQPRELIIAYLSNKYNLIQLISVKPERIEADDELYYRARFTNNLDKVQEILIANSSLLEYIWTQLLVTTENVYDR